MQYVYVVKFWYFHFTDNDSETLNESTSYVTVVVAVASLITGFTVVLLCTFCCPRHRGSSQVVFVEFFCYFLQFLSVECIVLTCTYYHFLGRLLRVDLIKWVSNVRSPIRTSICSTKSFFDFNEIWYVGRGRWVMHNGMQYDPIQGQGQGHEPSKVGNSVIFNGYFLHL